MNQSRLKLVSSHGDQTMPGMRFVTYTTSSEKGTDELLVTGLRFVEGKPVVSANLLSSLEGHEADTVFVMSTPQEFFLGHGVFTTAYIDRTLKHVLGYPIKYAGARKELAFYHERQTEDARERIEAEVAEGYVLDQQPTFVVAPSNIVGHFQMTPGYHSAVARIRVCANNFNAADLPIIEEELVALYRPSEPAASVITTSVMSDLLIGTIESLIISRMRLMRWQGLKLLGYKFQEGQRPVTVPEPEGGQAGLRRTIEELDKMIVSSTFFVGRLAWLKDYIATELKIIRIELDVEA